MAIQVDINILKDFLEKLKGDIQSSLDSSGVNASGNLRNSLRVEVGAISGKLVGARYAGAVEVGRKPTVAGGNGTLKDAIRQWIDDKGINPIDITKDSLAYVIARSIHKKGTLLHQDGVTDHYGRSKPSMVINGVIEDGRLENLSRAVAASILSQITNNLKFAA
jgi:hypothetical protein